jgi:hypothetical protein
MVDFQFSNCGRWVKVSEFIKRIKADILRNSVVPLQTARGTTK